MTGTIRIHHAMLPHELRKMSQRIRQQKFRDESKLNPEKQQRLSNNKNHRGHVLFYVGTFLSYHKYYYSKKGRKNIIEQFAKICRYPYAIHIYPNTTPYVRKSRSKAAAGL